MAHSIVIFGASGDLTSRKLIPALYSLFSKGRLPENTIVVGIARSEFSHEAWRDELREKAKKFLGSSYRDETWNDFAKCVYYCPGDLTEREDMLRLAEFLKKTEPSSDCTRLYYLATMPQLYEPAIAQLGACGMVDRHSSRHRIVIEKPIGTDLASAKRLNQAAQKVFSEDQIYRIDHYLGKESVQNMLVLRFANSIFEPLWNRNYVDHVQITVAEEVPVGSRAGYYDKSGVLRDMFQNHLLQLLMITAMETPSRYEADLVRDEKVKVLRALRPMTGEDFAERTVRGQYEGYLKEKDVPAGSQTATFAALKLYVDNWRWNNVPFYLRSGKAMSCRTTQIVIQFREPPHMLFTQSKKLIRPQANRLVMQIQPAEGIHLEFQTKVPDAGMTLRSSDLDYSFDREYHGEMPDAYQRLLLDAMLGDASLFARSDEVELAWSAIDPIIAAWQSPSAPPVYSYPVGNWGPEYSSEWMERQGRQWYDVCPVLH